MKRFWEFIEAGKYAGRFKADDERKLYRFDKPANDKYLVVIEIFSRKPSNVDLAEGQQIVPIKLDADSASLSAILLNDDYYEAIEPMVCGGNVTSESTIQTPNYPSRTAPKESCTWNIQVSFYEASLFIAG